jgi:hypothetical protein
MSILLARTSLDSCIIQINRIEQSAYIHICNTAVLLSKNMTTKNWNYRGKYFYSVIFGSILVLSSFGILVHDSFANTVIDSIKITDHDNTISSIPTNSNIKHVNTQTDTNSKTMHVKSPTHIPPLILEQYMQSKLCKNKCIHPKSH